MAQLRLLLTPNTSRTNVYGLQERVWKELGHARNIVAVLGVLFGGDLFGELRTALEQHQQQETA